MKSGAMLTEPRLFLLKAGIWQETKALSYAKEGILALASNRRLFPLL